MSILPRAIVAITGGVGAGAGVVRSTATAGLRRRALGTHCYQLQLREITSSSSSSVGRGQARGLGRYGSSRADSCSWNQYSTSPSASRPLHTTHPTHLSSPPSKPLPTPTTTTSTTLTPTQYDTLSTTFLTSLLLALESSYFISSHPTIDCDYSAGVLTITTPKGTYVLNKQPPNKQIWLSSPVSGPKRYDYDEGSGEWFYRRDGSTLRGLLKEEVGVDMDVDGEGQGEGSG